MAARCQPVQHQWEGIVRGLIEGRYDAIMSSLEITPRRRKRIAFSRPYYRIPTAFIARKEADLPAVTPQALAGLRIGAVDRSRAAALVEGRYGGTELRTYGKLEEANLDLFTERLDLVVGDKLALSRFLASREGACCRFVGDVPPQAEADDGYGIGLRPQDTALKARFDRAIDEVMADGTYDRIRARYIPFDTK
jgi:polar amino acid transport system substrate-binding protein